MIRHPLDTPDLHELAVRRAHDLRERAIDALWDDGSDAVRRALRAATRFAQRLARHRRQRYTLPT